MAEYCGMIVTIKDVFEDIDNNVVYYMEEIDCDWTDEMIEGLAEEETKLGTAYNPIEIKSNANCLTNEGLMKKIKPKFCLGDKVILDPYPCIVTNVQWKDGYGFVYTVRGTDFGKIAKEDELVFDERPTPTTDKIVKKIKADWNNFKSRYNLPNDYHFVDKNGNEINISEIVLEKKKKEYPKTYEECCTVLHFHYDHYLTYDDEKNLPVSQDESDFIDSVDAFAKLMICKKAYWKIAGEEMGLDKPWEPDWGNPDHDSYPTITRCGGKIIRTTIYTHDCPLSFPTEEMRDAFYENFKELIKICKELL